MSRIFYIIVCIFIAGCARAPIKDRSQAMRLSTNPPLLADDLGYESLVNGLKANIFFIKNSTRASNELTIGPTKINKKKYIQALEFLLDNSTDLMTFQENIKKLFDFYEVYGLENWAQIKATSYYAPVIQGSLKPTRQFSQALYLTPDDLLSIDVDAFAEVFPKWKIFKEQIMEQKTSHPIVRARLTSEHKIVPYYDREDIDSHKSIEDKKLILVYVDPIKAFFLQIQGSGTIKLPDDVELRVGYANQNGHAYVAIGTLLMDKIPKEKMSMQAIEAYLRTLPKKEMQKVLNQNPSYVFFQILSGKPLTYLGTETVDGRTVATDNNFFPKGTLAFLEFEKPIFETIESTEPKAWVKSARFVLDQDTGGAIRGPGRLDLYSGSGSIAEQFSGVMKNPGRLHYLVPKSEFLKSLRE